MTAKIIAGINCLLACFVCWLAMPRLMAEKEIGSEYWLLHPLALGKCMEDETALAIDYSIHPYYLRVDLDGDNEMEYVINLLDKSGRERIGLMICHEGGNKTIYRGVAEREVSIEDKDRIGKMWGVVKDAVLIEGQTSVETMNSTGNKTFSWPVRNLFDYVVAKCCYGQGKNKGGQLIFTELNYLQTIPIGATWYPLSKNQVLSWVSEHDDIRNRTKKVAGEGIVTVWELTTSIGFVEGNQFRWFVRTLSD